MRHDTVVSRQADVRIDAARIECAHDGAQGGRRSEARTARREAVETMRYVDVTAAFDVEANHALILNSDPTKLAAGEVVLYLGRNAETKLEHRVAVHVPRAQVAALLFPDERR